MRQIGENINSTSREYYLDISFCALLQVHHSYSNMASQNLLLRQLRTGNVTENCALKVFFPIFKVLVQLQVLYGEPNKRPLEKTSFLSWSVEVLYYYLQDELISSLNGKH